VSRVDVGGIGIEARVEGPSDASPLVLVNSAGSDQRMWDRTLPALGDGFRLVRYDARGHGGSDVPPSPYTLDQLGGDLLGLLDALAIPRAHVVGASLGGLVALWLAARHPDRIDRAVFAGTAARIGSAAAWQERADTVRTEGIDAVVDLVMERFFSARFRGEHGDVVAGFADALRAQSPQGYEATCLALRDADLRDEIRRIRASSLVVVGELDRSTPPTDAEQLRDAIPGSRLVRLEGAGHLCAVEEPDRFGDIVGRFLREPA
jgi:3-oxoadipate enol-lactonase